MKLGLFVEPYGRHVAAWRHPNATRQAGVSYAHYRDMARMAEAAKFDFMFIADTNNVWENMDFYSRSNMGAILDPLQLLAALAVSTERIGLISTTSTTYTQPYHVARTFASLDQLSGGRAGWNLVTSMFPGEAKNFSMPKQMAHEDRYERAEEFVDVVLGLWSSFERDAFVEDRATGLFFDPDRLHVLHHQGKHFAVRGPLNVPQSAQGHPVVVQAGSSGPGRELAARTAEVVFTIQQTLSAAQAFYADLKSRMPKYGRRPDQLLVMPGLFIMAGRTESEAREKYEEMQSLVHPKVGLSLLSNLIGGFDLSAYDVDGPLPELPQTNGGQGHQNALVDRAIREGLTIRQLYLATVGGRGHWELVGTPEQIVDQMEERVLKGGADGFNVMPPFPGELKTIIDLVLPELRRRGLFRTEYEGTTLRDSLGFDLPCHARQQPEGIAS
ncbi:LLM class flavin-dependent oxidoreductase [Humitalea sp. 24SJ18S-53]|uniref:LLM class flavin-dependent oxidoreductase n=1 Tax=Humitalea sp. 24SJ18S-53 TaxID=3422307 RepID=UPI003D67C89F